MRDDVESYVEKHWDDLATGVRSGLDETKRYRLDAVVGVSTAPSPLLYRAATRWVAKPLIHGEIAQVEVDPLASRSAYRFRTTLPIPSESDADALRDAARGLGRRAVRAETRAFLQLVRELSTRTQAQALTPDAVRRAAADLDSHCRLVTALPDLKALVDGNHVDELVVLPRDVMPAGVAAVLVATAAPHPRVELVGDDLAPTWQRGPTHGTATLALTTCFFLFDAEQSAVFTSGP